MAKKITDEKIIEINEVYLQCGVKSQTAKICGVSPASVTKYLIKDYKARKDTKIEEFNKEAVGCQSFIDFINQNSNTAILNFCNFCKLSEEEKNDLRELQKEILV